MLKKEFEKLLRKEFQTKEKMGSVDTS